MQTEALRNLVAKIKHLQCEMQTVELKATNKGCPTRKPYPLSRTFSKEREKQRPLLESLLLIFY